MKRLSFVTVLTFFIAIFFSPGGAFGQDDEEITRPPEFEKSQGATLTPGKSLKAKEYLESPNGLYGAVMDPGGGFSLWDL